MIHFNGPHIMHLPKKKKHKPKQTPPFKEEVRKRGRMHARPHPKRNEIKKKRKEG